MLSIAIHVYYKLPDRCGWLMVGCDVTKFSPECVVPHFTKDVNCYMDWNPINILLSPF